MGMDFNLSYILLFRGFVQIVSLNKVSTSANIHFKRLPMHLVLVRFNLQTWENALFVAEEVLTTSHSKELHLQVHESTVQLMNSEVQLH